MTEEQIAAIRARLRFNSLEEFIQGYARYISPGGIFIPMAEHKLKPLGTTVRFQFLLQDGTTALLGEGMVHQLHPPDPTSPGAPVGILVKFTKLSQSSKQIVERISAAKGSGQHSGQGPANHGNTAYGLPHSQLDDESVGLEEATAHGDDQNQHALRQLIANSGQHTVDKSIHDAATPLPSAPSPTLDSEPEQDEPAPAAPAPFSQADPSEQAQGFFDDELEKPASTTPPEPQDEDFFDLAQSFSGPKSKPETVTAPAPNYALDALFGGGELDFGLDEGLIEQSLGSMGGFSRQDESHTKRQENPFIHEAPTNGGQNSAQLLTPLEPPRIAQTEGGIQVIAYNNDADPAQEALGLAEMSMSESEDEDDLEIDEAFDNIFGGSGGNDNSGGFGRMFSSPSLPPLSAATPEPVAQPEPTPEAAPTPSGPAPSEELENLLGSLEDDDNEDLTSFNLDTGINATAPPAEEDDSLDDLLALARKDMEELHQRKEQEAQANSKDLLEQLLGDDINLPPPPNANSEDNFLAIPPPRLPTPQAPDEEESTPDEVEAPEEEEEEAKEEKKGGFFSSLFKRK